MYLFSPVGKIDLGHIRLNFWDLGGQEELQLLWDKVSLSNHSVRMSLGVTLSLRLMWSDMFKT